MTSLVRQCVCFGWVRSVMRGLHCVPTERRAQEPRATVRKQTTNKRDFRCEHFVQTGVNPVSVGPGRIRRYNVFMSGAHEALLYSRVETVIADEITGGGLKVGDQLPTEDSLIARFGSAGSRFAGLFKIL